MDYREIIFEKRDQVAILTVNRLAELNTLSPRTVEEMRQGIREVEDDDAIKVLIVTGVKKFFVAGAQLREIRHMSHLEIRRYLGKILEVISAIENLEKPVIAAINGHAMGGGMELAVACDFRVMSTEAKMGFPEINLGSCAGATGTTRLPRMVGLSKATELIFLGKAIDAKEALALGLANRIVPPDQVMAAALELAEELARKALWALKATKAALNVGISVDVASGRKYALDEMAISFGTEDMKEGIDAFLEKRPPRFKGK